MRVIFDRPALLGALNLLCTVVPGRTPRPILECVAISIDKNQKKVEYRASDGDIHLRLVGEKMDPLASGECAINAHRLQQIAAAQQNDATLTVETGERDRLEIKGSDACYKVYTVPVKEFPPAPEIAKPVTLEISSQVLARIIRGTLFASATETTRYAINGINITADGESVDIVATDGRRLALWRQKLKASGRRTCIIPTKAFRILDKILGDLKDLPVSIELGDTQASFEVASPSSSIKLVTNLMEGTFPPYRDVIPSNQTKRAVMDGEALNRAVRRATLMTNQESRGIRFKFEPDLTLNLSSRAPEMGEADVGMTMKEYEGGGKGGMEIGFNPSFIQDALKVMDGDVTITLDSPNKPGVMRQGDDFTYVVMPVNLQ